MFNYCKHDNYSICEECNDIRRQEDAEKQKDLDAVNEVCWGRANVYSLTERQRNYLDVNTYLKYLERDKTFDV